MRTFKDFDQLGLEGFGHQLTSFIKTERQFVEKSLVLSLNASFGSGKSTFLDMWRNSIETAEEPAFAFIPLNAWDADYDKDPLLAIIRGFIGYFKESGEKQNTENLKTLGGKLAKIALSVGNQVVKNQTGLDIKQAGKEAEPEHPDILARACFKVYEERQNAFGQLKELLSNLIKKQERPIIIVVDELDRSRPDYAVEYLETIKHIFDIDGLVFVLGVDHKSLESSVKALFGDGIIFSEYYRKFVHRNINLPEPEKAHLTNYAQYLTEHYFSESEQRFNYAEIGHSRIENLCELFTDFKLTPRQIEEVFRTLSHSLSSFTKPEGKLRWGYTVGTIFMATLSIADHSLYHKIGKANVNEEVLIDFIGKCPMLLKSDLEGNYPWWTPLF